METKESDPLARWSLAIALCPLLPIPFLDFFLVPILARRMFKPMVPKFQARYFVKTGDSYCMGCLVSMVLWPFMKFISVFRFFFKFKSYIEIFQYWFYKAHITQYAIENYPEGYWKDKEKSQEFADELDAFLRRKEMKQQFSQNMKNVAGEHGIWATLKLLFWTTELEQGTEATIEQQSPHLPTHTPVIMDWLEEQQQKVLITKELDEEFDV